MTPSQKLKEIRSIIMSHVGDRQSLENKILKIIDMKNK